MRSHSMSPRARSLASSGPNGAGKTTSSGILLGLLHGDAGTAKIGGHDCWTDHSRASRFFGATLEQPGFYGFLSGRDNLRQFARMLGPVDEKQIRALLDLVGMTERADDKVKRYSMGMRQRWRLLKRCWVRRACSCWTNLPTGWTPTASTACASFFASW